MIVSFDKMLQLGPKKVVKLSDLEQKWKDNCLPNERLYSLLQLGSFGDDIEWLKFFALACSALAGVSFDDLQCIGICPVHRLSRAVYSLLYKIQLCVLFSA